MSVCVYICVCLYMCVSIYVCVYICVCLYMCVSIYVCLYMCVYICVCLYMCVCVCVCVCAHACVCVCAHACVCVYICSCVLVCVHVRARICFLFVFASVRIYVCRITLSQFSHTHTHLNRPSYASTVRFNVLILLKVSSDIVRYPVQNQIHLIFHKILFLLLFLPNYTFLISYTVLHEVQDFKIISY